MNKIAPIPISKSEVFPDTDEFEQEYDSIKLISQEIIEEKEAIIQQIYKQLKDSIRTIDVLTTQLETYKQNQPQEINLTELQNKGFLRKENDHYFIIVDVTKAILSNREHIKMDVDLQIINDPVSDKIKHKFKVLQTSYSRAMQQCDLFLKALSQKQQKEEIMNKQIQSLNKSEAELKEQSSKLKEQVEMLKIQYDQHKIQSSNQKSFMIKQRQQLCLELSELKKIMNKHSQKNKQLEDQNKQLKHIISQLEDKLKNYQLQKMEREYYQSDLIRSCKQSIKYVDYSAQYPERESEFNKENKMNVGNIQSRNINNFENKEMLDLVRIDSILIDERGQKIAKKPFQVKTPTQSKQSSPSREHPNDYYDVNNYPHDTFPQANTIQKFGQKEQEEMRNKHILHKQGQLKGKKQRKVIRINY